MANNPLFKFDVDTELLVGIGRLSPILGFDFGEEITVKAEKSDKNGVTLKNGKAVIYYTRKSIFFRELGILAETAKTKDEFEIFEDCFFVELSTMIDASRCAVPTVKSMFRLIDRLALMGYNMAMLYTEDTIELENRPHFGYMRGAYTKDELRA
ncbi:MAG: beta-N-acetylhexosaminidase, partial [Clostridia bacterium]|nr:beta-N-acetylhexosaminidase [Clostridia bacterium]